MARDDGYLLRIWQEVCRHLRLEDSAGRVVPLVAQRLPVSELMVREIDRARGSLETVAVGPERPGSAPGQTKTVCSSEDLERIVTWCRTGEPVRGSELVLRKRLPGLVPPGVKGQVIGVPLVTSEGATGALLLVARPPRTFGAADEDIARALGDPFTVALENDHRLRELESLREAVEADNRSLLSRLERHDISDSIVGAETGLKPVMDQIELVAGSDVPVLVMGETGSGKEVVARAVHRRSRRGAHPFVRVNCGAIPTELVDSELFGHERGSFTGAVGERKGWFERADGGTLFLDECGELPQAAQVRLLRILQDGTFERVGGEHARHVDVRIVAATHRNLEAMVATGGFRQDLWYRLAVFPIRLPPLRERPSDIAALAAHFSLRAAKRLGLPPLVPSAGDISQLISYAWPGNVRELAAVIERAAILGGGNGLEIAKALGGPATEMPRHFADAPRALNGPTNIAMAASSAREGRDHPASLDHAMKQHIEHVLERTRGRVEGPHGAAAILEINPHTLRSRMKKLGVSWAAFRGG